MDWLFPVGALVAPLRAEIVRQIEQAAPTIDADAVKIVLNELLFNVSRHAQSSAVVSFDAVDHTGVLTVADNGPGYFTTEFCPPESFSESGRGLWLADQLADRLRVQASLDGGTTVTAEFSLDR